VRLTETRDYQVTTANINHDGDRVIIQVEVHASPLDSESIQTLLWTGEEPLRCDFANWKLAGDNTDREILNAFLDILAITLHNRCYRGFILRGCLGLVRFILTDENN